MKKKILFGSIIAVVLLTLVSFSSVVGYSSVKSNQDNTIITDEYDSYTPIQLVFQLISKLRNHKDIQNIETEDDVLQIIEGDEELNSIYEQLSGNDCGCEEDTVRLWHFPVICTLLIPWGILGMYMLLIGWRARAPIMETMGAILLVTVETIANTLDCWWRRDFPGISDTSPADSEQNVPINITELSFRLTDNDDDLMSYRVTTNPSIGEGEGTLVPNGIYNVPVHGVQPSTQYSWEISLYEGDDIGIPIKETFTFTTASVNPVISKPRPIHNAPYVPFFTSKLSFNLLDYQGDMMNWTVETQPDIGSGSANDVGDGRYSIAINGLENETQYTWFVNATDGTNWKRETYVFTTTPEGLLVLEPIFDTYVTEVQPNDNFLGSKKLELSYDNDSYSHLRDSRTIILFNLSYIPAESIIISTKLNLYYYDYNIINPSGREITCHRILEDWDETAVTYNTMPYSDPVEFASTNAPSGFGWVEWNVTAEVDAHLNSGVENYGWMIRDFKNHLEYSCYHWYYSYDAYNDYPPRLFVWYNPP